MASAGEAKAWEVETGQRPYGLQVVKLKRIYVLAWTQFLYAEGSSEEVKAVFSTHDVVVKGTDLTSLLSDFAAQRITVLKEPARTDRFASVLCRKSCNMSVLKLGVSTDALRRRGRVRLGAG
jgi:hypothetical protein